MRYRGDSEHAMNMLCSDKANIWQLPFENGDAMTRQDLSNFGLKHRRCRAKCAELRPNLTSVLHWWRKGGLGTAARQAHKHQSQAKQRSAAKKLLWKWSMEHSKGKWSMKHSKGKCCKEHSKVMHFIKDSNCFVKHSNGEWHKEPSKRIALQNSAMEAPSPTKGSALLNTARGVLWGAQGSMGRHSLLHNRNRFPGRLLQLFFQLGLAAPATTQDSCRQAGLLLV